MRFLADMGVGMWAVRWLREQGHEATHVREHGMDRAADRAIFERARNEGSVLLTFDLDFAEIASLDRDGIVSVILFRLVNTRAGFVIERLSRVLNSAGDQIAAGCVVTVEDGRHRVRLLPIGRER